MAKQTGCQKHGQTNCIPCKTARGAKTVNHGGKVRCKTCGQKAVSETCRTCKKAAVPFYETTEFTRGELTSPAYLGPNLRWPFAVKITNPNEPVQYERFSNPTVRDNRMAVLARYEHQVEPVDYTGGNEEQNETEKENDTMKTTAKNTKTAKTAKVSAKTTTAALKVKTPKTPKTPKTAAADTKGEGVEMVVLNRETNEPATVRVSGEGKMRSVLYKDGSVAILSVRDLKSLAKEAAILIKSRTPVETKDAELKKLQTAAKRERKVNKEKTPKVAKTAKKSKEPKEPGVPVIKLLSKGVLYFTKTAADLLNGLPFVQVVVTKNKVTLTPTKAAAGALEVRHSQIGVSKLLKETTWDKKSQDLPVKVVGDALVVEVQ